MRVRFLYSVCLRLLVLAWLPVLKRLGLVMLRRRAEPTRPSRVDWRPPGTFIDHYLIDQMKDVRLVLHEPVDRGVVIRCDSPWENPFAGCPTVIKDGSKYRLYYRGMYDTGDDADVACVCYAESTDGVHWTKPNLGLFEVRGTRENNSCAPARPALLA